MTHNHNKRADPKAFREIGKRLSNWGRWGSNDRIGTLNHITPQRRAAAAKLARSGRIFDMGLDFSPKGIQVGGGLRSNPIHLMSLTPLDNDKSRHDKLLAADDYIIMPLQCATQWDGLAHVGYDDLLYNNIPADTITTYGGSKELSIHQIAEAGVIGRGVLLDIARLKEVEFLKAGESIYPDDLEAAEKRQGVKVGPGDIVCVRTGWIRQFTVHGSRESYWKGNPGITVDSAEWLHKRDVAAITSDNYSVEMISAEDAALSPVPFHCVAIRDMGMTLGEIFNLESLSGDCASDGIWEFLFVGPPLKVVNGVGSPITPFAMK
jgi:kynurenine formamidase